MDEYLDILTENGKHTGKRALKSEAHKKGLFHATVHVWLYTKNGDVLLQKRASTKQTFPNYWDVSVAGHVLAGETIGNAAIRETKEEIGITILKRELVKIDIRKNINRHPNGINDHEFQNVFLYKLGVPFNELKKQDDEVDALCLLSLEELKYFTENRNETFKLVPADYSYYTFVIEKIHNMINI